MYDFMFIWLVVRFYLLFAEAIGVRAKISSGDLVFVSYDVFVFP